MIFVTVGTHEQQFDRLIKEVDYLKKENLIQDEVFIQIGYSSYIPKYCEW
ncbi:TPA: multidrug MFS transporter, partial [Streptococcus pneumoniae]|nr:multidrug MFS transporter [Streptococcus pneumoniae]